MRQQHLVSGCAWLAHVAALPLVGRRCSCAAAGGMRGLPAAGPRVALRLRCTASTAAIPCAAHHTTLHLDQAATIYGPHSQSH